jgi:hypothetical protein
MPPEEPTGACCGFPTTRVNLYTYMSRLFTQGAMSEEHDGDGQDPSIDETMSMTVKDMALEFLDAKRFEMSKDTTPAVFCQNSLDHEATSDTSSPYSSSPSNCCFLGTYPVDGPLVRDGRERGREGGERDR